MTSRTGKYTFFALPETEGIKFGSLRAESKVKAMLGAPLTKSILELGGLSVQREGKSGGRSETVLFTTSAKELLDHTGALRTDLCYHGPVPFRKPLKTSLLDEHYVLTDMYSPTP